MELVAARVWSRFSVAALTRLVGGSGLHALACTRLETVLTSTPAADARDQLPAPTRDVKTLLALLRLDLEARPPVPPSPASLAHRSAAPRGSRSSVPPRLPTACDHDRAPGRAARRRPGRPPRAGQPPSRALHRDAAPPPPPLRIPLAPAAAFGARRPPVPWR
jgi:hypothetical protein